MIHRIDHIALWVFVTVSAFLTMLSFTNFHIPLAAFFTFAAVLALHLLIQRIPCAPYVSKKDRASYASHLLRQWALSGASESLEDIFLRLPQLAASQNSSVHLVQRIPESTAFDANDLLDLWHSFRGKTDHLLLLLCCSSKSDASALAKELTHPSVRLIDKNQLISLLLPTLHTIPAASRENIKTERRASLLKRTALWIEAINPVRCFLYTASFLALYLWNRSWIYLGSAALFGVLSASRLLKKFLR